MVLNILLSPQHTGNQTLMTCLAQPTRDPRPCHESTRKNATNKNSTVAPLHQNKSLGYDRKHHRPIQRTDGPSKHLSAPLPMMNQ
jgi:hypothetical protein